MLLSVFTRHSTGCKFSRDRACHRCNCPKWVDGQLSGYSDSGPNDQCANRIVEIPIHGKYKSGSQSVIQCAS